MKLLPILLVCVLATMAGDYTRIQNGLALGALCVWFGYGLMVTYEPAVGLAFAILAASAIRVFAAPGDPYGAIGPLGSVSVNYVTAAAFGALVLYTSVFGYLLPRRLAVKVAQWIVVMAEISAVFVLYHWARGGLADGVLQMGTMDGLFLAMVFPALMLTALEGTKQRIDTVWALVVLAAIFATHGRAALIALVAGVCAFLWVYLQDLGRVILGTSLAAVSLMGCSVAYYRFGHSMIQDGRTEVWRLAVAHLGGPLGNGLGSWGYLGPMYQYQTQKTVQGFYLALHNDWLQLLFEAGWLGVGSVILLYAVALRRCYQRPAIFGCLVAYGVGAVFYYPAHLPVTAIFGATLLRLAMDPRPPSSKVEL